MIENRTKNGVLKIIQIVGISASAFTGKKFLGFPNRGGAQRTRNLMGRAKGLAAGRPTSRSGDCHQGRPRPRFSGPEYCRRNQARGLTTRFLFQKSGPFMGWGNAIGWLGSIAGHPSHEWAIIPLLPRG